MAKLTTAETEILTQAAEIIHRETGADGTKITVKDLGTFKRVLKAARVGRNPKTGESVQIPAKSVLTFKAPKA